MTSAIDSVLNYHERTKHYLDHYARSLGYLDWASQPIPFRRYGGAPCVTLEHGDNSQGPLYRDLVASPIAPSPITFQSISRLFYYSMALSAWKNIPDGNSWSLRVNPSSGNLHPTESYLIIGPQASPGIKSGLYHYDSYHHALELRRLFGKHLWKALACGISENGFFIGLSSIYWREAWKYGERAYRYCHHDVGHALGAIAIAAASLGWQAQLIDSLTDKDISIFLGIEDQVGIEAEHADCLVVVYPNDKRAEIESNKGQWLPMLTEKPLEEMKNIPLLGEINQLSENHHEWPIIDEVSLAARKMQEQNDDDLDRPSKLPLNASVLSQCNETAFQIIRQRRSAVAMDGETSMERSVFFGMLQRLQCRKSPPFECLPWAPTVSLFLFVHRVRDLEPGLYVLVRHDSHEASLRQSIKSEFLWKKPQENPEGLRYYLLAPQNVEEVAKVISCHQDIAADGVFSLGMLARFDAVKNNGAYFYPRLFWETGLIGQLLYLEAEAAGLRSTGIGCFFDDVMHEVLGISDLSWQSLYHFTVGGPIEDTRLQTYPAYLHLDSLKS
ncbi:MAG: SagB/ThcOx family dehydrogenase [Proteobacteria bacterium]|nr:SagB/ThcOx family dehydrogenase [Pseudomonadota bacterium]